MIHFSAFPDQAPIPPEFSISSTITSHAGRYYSAATPAPVWAGLDTRTAPTGRGWLLTKPGCPANARH
ncbi:MAG: hypothetical protein ACRYFZ_23655 [Janthinobacterium lividum]